MKKPYKTIILALAVVTCVMILKTNQASAASFSVASGTDTVAVDSTCNLTEAIENLNNQATTNADCAPTGAYGTNDTINLPTGTITLSADLPQITKPVSIVGAGMGQTIVDGDNGQFQPFQYQYSSSNDLFSIKKLTIKAFKNSAIYGENGSFTAEEIEADGTDLSAISGIQYFHNLSQTAAVNIHNIVVHNFNSSVTINGILISGEANGGTVNLDLSNVTINNLSSTDVVNSLAVGTGLSSFEGHHHINANIQNVTISNIHSAITASGFTVVNFSAGGVSDINADVSNITITNIRGGSGAYGASAAIGTVGAGIGAGDVAQNNITLRNSLVADNLNTSTSEGNNCRTDDFTSLLGGSGSVTNNFTSDGGNLSDDSTCTPYFNQAKDQNNVTKLASTLGVLTDNGGLVPTMALLKGSPAIDAGVVVAGLNNDARGAVRPQGNGFDSGAYESAFTRVSQSPAGKPVQPAASERATLAESGNSIFIPLLAGVTTLVSTIMVARKRVLVLR